jgi:hypothetical protein
MFTSDFPPIDGTCDSIGCSVQVQSFRRFLIFNLTHPCFLIWDKVRHFWK